MMGKKAEKLPGWPSHYWNNATWRSSFFIVSSWVVGYANLLLYVSNI